MLEKTYLQLFYLQSFQLPSPFEENQYWHPGMSLPPPTPLLASMSQQNAPSRTTMMHDSRPSSRQQSGDNISRVSPTGDSVVYDDYDHLNGDESGTGGNLVSKIDAVLESQLQLKMQMDHILEQVTALESRPVSSSLSSSDNPAVRMRLPSQLCVSLFNITS